ncbi:hypothetical protein PT974_00862 [Cladobotryum mycophilum]|uniref:Uncharacterized protein n=1 Tax=Cladobotryum mycophilum TaxID=491253 RepID=A0ABR0T221_9HYPO
MECGLGKSASGEHGHYGPMAYGGGIYIELSREDLDRGGAAGFYVLI